MPDQVATSTRLGTTSEPDSTSPIRVVVWDRVVRGFHWALAGTIATSAATAYFAGARWIDVHVWAGAAAAALVVGRIVWGFLGPTHARFSDFLTSPAAVLAHARALIAGRPARHRGHNPIGGAMIVTLLIVIAAIAATGALALGGVLKAGPFSFATTFAFGSQARDIHEALAAILLGLIAFHIVGAVFESRRTRENLVRAMIDGRKAARHDDHPSTPRLARPLRAAAVVAALFVVTAAVLWTLNLQPGLGVPIGKVDPVYAEECGACHTVYHPSLLPKAAWRALITGLDNHFGENAGLDAETAARLTDYLTANAAETADTLPANRLRRVDAAEPFTITATPFWKRRHADIADAIFASKAVGGRGHCEACHADARSGRFHPANIAIPKEAKP